MRILWFIFLLFASTAAAQAQPSLSAKGNSAGATISVDYNGLDPRTRYWLILLDPTRQSGKNGQYFGYQTLSGRPNGTATFVISDPDTKNLLARLHKAIPNSPVLTDIMLRSDIPETSTETAQTSPPAKSDPAPKAEPAPETASRVDCKGPVTQEGWAECFSRDILLYVNERLMSGRASWFLSQTFNKMLLKPMERVSCFGAQMAIEKSLEEFPPEIAARYPAEIPGCAESLKIFEEIIGTPRRFDACEAWKDASEIERCFIQVATAFETGVYEDAVVNFKKRFALGGRRTKFVQFAYSGPDTQRLRNTFKDAPLTALKADVAVCFDGRKFQNYGFIDPIRSHEKDGGYFLIYSDLRDLCPALMEIAYKYGAMDDAENQKWVAILERDKRRRLAAKAARAAKTKRDLAAMQILADRQAARNKARAEYLATPEGMLSVQAVQSYNRIEMPQLCNRVARGLAYGQPFSGQTIQSGGIYEVDYNYPSCRLTTFLGAYVEWTASSAKVDQCSGNTCRIDLYFTCKFRGSFMAQSCEDAWRGPMFSGRVFHDGDFNYVKIE